MLAQQFLPEPGAKIEPRSPALLQAHTSGTKKIGSGPANLLRCCRRGWKTVRRVNKNKKSWNKN